MHKFFVFLPSLLPDHTVIHSSVMEYSERNLLKLEKTESGVAVYSIQLLALACSVKLIKWKPESDWLPCTTATD